MFILIILLTTHVYLYTSMRFLFIGKLDIFLLMCADDKVWITELTLIHKNIRSVCNSRISQSDAKHIMTSPIKRITSVLKVSTDIITSIAVSPIKLRYW